MTPKKSKGAEGARGDVAVYCGPTIPGVAKQYTIYSNGLPAALEERAGKAPELRGLVVPLPRLPEAMKQLRERSGPIYRLYCMVQAEH